MYFCTVKVNSRVVIGSLSSICWQNSLASKLPALMVLTAHPEMRRHLQYSQW